MAGLGFVGKVIKAHTGKSRTGRLGLGEGDSPFLSSLSVGSSGIEK